MEAREVLERNVCFLKVHERKNFLTKLFKHKVLGKVELALELGLITEEEAYKFIDEIFKTYEELSL